MNDPIVKTITDKLYGEPESDPTKFTLTISLGNDAMQLPEHVAEVLAALSLRLGVKVDWGVGRGAICDINGNTVGRWELT